MNRVTNCRIFYACVYLFEISYFTGISKWPSGVTGAVHDNFAPSRFTGSIDKFPTSSGDAALFLTVTTSVGVLVPNSFFVTTRKLESLLGHEATVAVFSLHSTTDSQISSDCCSTTYIASSVGEGSQQSVTSSSVCDVTLGLLVGGSGLPAQIINNLAKLVQESYYIFYQ